MSILRWAAFDNFLNPLVLILTLAYSFCIEFKLNAHNSIKILGPFINLNSVCDEVRS
jgi:hypothetical protein